MDLSIIIVSYNTKELTLSCIDSIKKNTKGIDYEIIIIDNDSKDGSKEALKRLETGSLKVILNKNNLGFAAANNQGIGLAKGKYALFMNSDTLVENNVLGEMVDWMDENPKAGIATCKLVGRDGSFQPTGGYFPDLFRVFAWMAFLDDLPVVSNLFKSFHPHKNFYLRGHQQDWVTGAFLMTMKDIVEKAGGWDENYFMYFEEVDLCYRIKKMGWKVWYLPEWSIVHLGGASSTKEFPILSEFKGIKRFYKKFYPSWQYPILRLLLKIGALGRIIIFRSNTYVKAFKQV